MVDKGLKNINGLFEIPVKHCCTSGIYFLCIDDEIVYIGQSVNIYRRINDHFTYKQRTYGGKKFNKIFAVCCKRSELLDLERAFITEFKPKYNSMRNIHESNGIFHERLLIEKIWI